MEFKSILKKLECPHPEGLTNAEMFLASEDLLPVTEDKKTWNHWNFVSFWIADSFNLNTFTIASSMIAAGLTWWQAFLCVIIGYTLVGPLIVLNARPGAIFGITFPVVNRTTFGLFGSLWPVLNRAGMACIWWGVQAWLGGQCVYVLLRSIFPSFARIPNSMPASTETTTAYVVAFIIYWVLSLPTIWVPIHKLRWLFFAKAIIGPIIGFTLFGWSISRAGGVGPVFSQPATLSGSARSWQMLISISSTFNNMFTLITIFSLPVGKIDSARKIPKRLYSMTATSLPTLRKIVFKLESTRINPINQTDQVESLRPTMPSRKERQKDKARAEADARRAELGAGDDALEALNREAATRQRIYSDHTIATFKPLRRNFDAWAMKAYPDGSFDTDAFFTTNSLTPPDYGILTAFLLERAADIKGRTGDDSDQLSERTIRREWDTLKAYYRYTTGEHINAALNTQVSCYIRDDIIPEFEVNTARPARPFVNFETLYAVILIVLSPQTWFLSTVQRWQALAAITIMLNTGFRAGSIWRLWQSETDKKDLTWGDLTLSIFPNKDDPEAPNRLVLRFIAPNGKTTTAKDVEAVITQPDEHWYDCLLYILVLAHFAKSLPLEWSVEEMYDPAIFLGTDVTHYDLRFQKANLPVFMVHSFGTEIAAWTTQAVRNVLAKASKTLCLERNIGTHVIRRSVHLAMKKQGENFQNIGRQLLHAWGTTTYEAYIGAYITTDLTAAVHGSSTNFGTTLEQHPEMIRKFIPVGETLGVDVYREIFEKPIIVSLVDSLETLTGDLKKEYNVDRVRQLPEQQRRAVKAAYQRFWRTLVQYQAYYRQVAANRLVDDRRNDLIDVANPDTEPIPEDIDPDDAAWEDESMEDDGDEPAGDMIDYEVLALEQLYTTVDFTSRQQAVNNAFDLGIIDPQQLEQQIQDQNDNDELSNLPSGWEGMALPDESRNSSVTTDTPIDPEDDQPGPSTRPPVKQSSSKGKGKQKQSNELVPESTTKATSVYSAHHRDWEELESMIKGGNQYSKLEVFNAAIKLPDDPFLLHSFRPGHAPVNAVCPSCDKPIDELFGTATGVSARNQFLIRHVNRCHAEAQRDAMIPTLVARYGPNSTITTNPIDGHVPSKSNISWGFWNFYSSRVIPLFKKKHDNEPYPTCQTCPEHPTLYSASQMWTHLHSAHDVLVVPSTMYRRPDNREVITADNFPFSDAVYYTDDESYHSDPQELEAFARDYYHRRILRPAEASPGYVVRQDVTVPEGVLEEDKFDGGEEDNKYLHRHYAQETTAISSEGICVICCNNHHLSYTERMLPHNSTVMIFRQHTTNCLHKLLRTLSALDQAKAEGNVFVRHSPYWQDGTYVCLDPNCVQRERFFETKLELVQHFVAVHKLHFKGNTARRGTDAELTLESLTFASEVDLENEVGWKHVEVARRNEAANHPDGRPVKEEDSAGEP